MSKMKKNNQVNPKMWGWLIVLSLPQHTSDAREWSHSMIGRGDETHTVLVNTQTAIFHQN